MTGARDPDWGAAKCWSSGRTGLGDAVGTERCSREAGTACRRCREGTEVARSFSGTRVEAPDGNADPASLCGEGACRALENVLEVRVKLSYSY